MSDVQKAGDDLAQEVFDELVARVEQDVEVARRLEGREMPDAKNILGAVFVGLGGYLLSQDISLPELMVELLRHPLAKEQADKLEPPPC